MTGNCDATFICNAQHCEECDVASDAGWFKEICKYEEEFLNKR